MLLAYEKYGLISAAYGFSPSHIISRKLSTVALLTLEVGIVDSVAAFRIHVLPKTSPWGDILV